MAVHTLCGGPRLLAAQLVELIHHPATGSRFTMPLAGTDASIESISSTACRETTGVMGRLSQLSANGMDAPKVPPGGILNLALSMDISSATCQGIAYRRSASPS
jgi:hypothetical protein